MIAWLGFVTVLALGLVVDIRGIFPGWIALIPTGAAILLIASGRTKLLWSVDALLSRKPFQLLGDISYGLYLVHWPLLVVVLIVTGSDHASVPVGLAAVAVSLVLAAVLTKLVDAPIRYSKWLGATLGRQVTVIIIALACVLGPSSAWRYVLDQQVANLLSDSDGKDTYPGALSLLDGYDSDVPADVPIIPSLDAIEQDWGTLDAPCSDDLLVSYPEGMHPCMMSATGDPNRRIIMIGDSRTEQMIPAFETLAEAYDYQLVASLRGAYSVGGPTDDLNIAVVEYIKAQQPTAVVLNDTAITLGAGEFVEDQLPLMIEEITNAGIHVIGIRGAPRFDYPPSFCVDEHSAPECSQPADYNYSEHNPAADIRISDSGEGQYYSIDQTEYICPDGLCVPVVGNVYVFMNANHMAATYWETLTPILGAHLEEAGWVW